MRKSGKLVDTWNFVVNGRSVDVCVRMIRDGGIKFSVNCEFAGTRIHLVSSDINALQADTLKAIRNAANVHWARYVTVTVSGKSRLGRVVITDPASGADIAATNALTNSIDDPDFSGPVRMECSLMIEVEEVDIGKDAGGRNVHRLHNASRNVRDGLPATGVVREYGFDGSEMSSTIMIPVDMDAGELIKGLAFGVRDLLQQLIESFDSHEELLKAVSTGGIEISVRPKYGE